MERFIQSALEHGGGELNSDDIMRLCCERDMQLWVVTREGVAVGAATTEVIVYPNKKRIRIVTLGGSEFEKWATLLDGILIGWAKENEAVGSEVFVRKGFTKKLSDLGYKERYIAMSKDF